ncbi:lactase/phlorizin hydrolase-like [Haliotis asinina]|uniref:lactase/phlorizin hydrolase-like n=1 Tax=Haliotis asinina TaxID=109174 RepID=UPI00353229B0
MIHHSSEKEDDKKQLSTNDDFALKVSYYRFSVSWSRILPNGTLSGGINQKGIDYYHILIAELLKNDIKPMVTLCHWDLPQALEDKGGFLNENFVYWFRDYADLCFKEFGNSVPLWITLHRPSMTAINSYEVRKVSPPTWNLTESQHVLARNLVLAHAEAFHLYNNTYRSRQEGKVGITINFNWNEPKDPLDISDVDASERSIEFYDGIFSHPIYVDGDWPPGMKERVTRKNKKSDLTGDRLASFSESEKERIKGTHDFLGLTVCSEGLMRHLPHHLKDGDHRTSHSTSRSRVKVAPSGIRRVLNGVKHNFNNVDVYFTGSCLSEQNSTPPDDHLVRFYRTFINEVLKAVNIDNCSVQGFTAWPLKNYSDPRFPKASSMWYAGLVQDNGYKPGYSRPGGRGSAVQGEGEFHYGTFPKDFLWSIASSSFQTEGAVMEDGRGESIWDNFRFVIHNDSGSVACDSYHKYPEDVRLLKNLGVDLYRFSIAWPRIFPDGTKASINPAGIQYYHRVLDALLATGIEPMVTLYHWDLPKALQDKGGWTNASIIGHFRDYADVCFKEYGNKVKLWVTFNEPWVFLVKGLEMGLNAPGYTNAWLEPFNGGHHVLLAHAEVYHMYNDTYRQTQHGKISITCNVDWAEPLDPTNSSDIEASEWALQMYIGWFANPVYVNGDYPEVLKTRIVSTCKAEGHSVSLLPAFTEAQKKRIKGTYDFFGLNHYTTQYVTKGNSTYRCLTTGECRPDFTPDIVIERFLDPNWPRSGSPWLLVVPWGMRKMLNWVRNTYGNIPIYLNENGLSDNNGTLDDQHRINFFRAYINEVLKAIDFDKVNVKSYTAWSLMDNFEWEGGYYERFGVHHVDFNSTNRTRTPRSSAAFLRHVFQDNGFKPGALTDPSRQSLPFENELFLGEFPEGFAWGASSSFSHIECRLGKEGNGLDSWVNLTKTAANGIFSWKTNADVVATLKYLGLKSYYFSLSWSRILPKGTSDEVNQDGVNYYNELLVALTDAQIEPIVSLHHWDTPGAIPDGWQDDKIVEAFGNYSRICFQNFGDKVRKWITHNEPNVRALHEYELGNYAPGVKGQGYRTAHNMIKAHAAAYRIYQKDFKKIQNGKVGLAVYYSWALPKTERDPGDWAALDRKLAFDCDWFVDPVLLDGDYPDVMKREVFLRSRQQNLTQSRLPVFNDMERNMIRGSTDFLGISYYTTILVEERRHNDVRDMPSIVDDRAVMESVNASMGRTNSPWFHVYPKGLRMVLRRLKERYGNIPVYVTGNGVSDKPGTSEDMDRVDYIKSHTNEVLKAILLDGVDVRGYTVYSVADSFERNESYSNAFGLYYVNLTDPNRQLRPKRSSIYYSSLIRDNGFLHLKHKSTA